MIPKALREWIEARLASVVRKQLARGRSDARTYATDGYPSGTDEPESGDEAARFQHYGFVSELPDNCELITLAIHGRASNRVAVAERHPNEPELQKGEVGLWMVGGQRVILTKDGDVVIYPKTGRDVIVGTSSKAAADKVVTESTLQAALDVIASHRHDVPPMGGTTTTSTELVDLSVEGSPNVFATKP